MKKAKSTGFAKPLFLMDGEKMASSVSYRGIMNWGSKKRLCFPKFVILKHGIWIFEGRKEVNINLES